MEYGSIEREVHVEAAPEVVFDVVSNPEHITDWWPDEAHYELVPGSSGDIVFGDPAADGTLHGFTVVEVDAPRRFSFRWTHRAGDTAAPGNSLLVTFELTPTDTGTLLHLTETGFREMGWEAAVLEEQYNCHVEGWTHFLPRLAPTIAAAAARS